MRHAEFPSCLRFSFTRNKLEKSRKPSSPACACLRPSPNANGGNARGCRQPSLHLCSHPVGRRILGVRFGKIQAAELVGREHHGSVLVLNQEHDEFRRFGLAGVPPDDVNIRGAFIEGLTSCQSDFLSAPYLHHD